jgi:hypothetical protein
VQRLLQVPLPDPAREVALRWQPSPLAARCLDALFSRALLPDHDSCDDPLTGTARWLLYVRAHYLRMPLHLLLPHLLRKSFIRPQESDDSKDFRLLQRRVEELLRLTPPSKGDARRTDNPAQPG